MLRLAVRQQRPSHRDVQDDKDRTLLSLPGAYAHWCSEARVKASEPLAGSCDEVVLGHGKHGQRRDIAELRIGHACTVEDLWRVRVVLVDDEVSVEPQEGPHAGGSLGPCGRAPVVLDLRGGGPK